MLHIIFIKVLDMNNHYNKMHKNNTVSWLNNYTAYIWATYSTRLKMNKQYFIINKHEIGFYV